MTAVSYTHLDVYKRQGVTRDAVACNEKGIDAFFPVVRGVSTLEEAMKPETAKVNVTDTVEQVFRLIYNCRR